MHITVKSSSGAEFHARVEASGAGHYVTEHHAMSIDLNRLDCIVSQETRIRAQNMLIEIVACRPPSGAPSKQRRCRVVLAPRGCFVLHTVSDYKSFHDIDCLLHCINDLN